jgi:hypothetical protein
MIESTDTFIQLIENAKRGTIRLSYNGYEAEVLSYNKVTERQTHDVFIRFKNDYGQWQVGMCNFSDIKEMTKPVEGELCWFWSTSDDLIAAYFEKIMWGDYVVRLEKPLVNGRMTLKRRYYANIDNKPF